MNPRVILVGTAATGTAVVAMLDAAAKTGSLLAAAALVVWVVGRKASASTRHVVWLCALTGSLLLPLSFRLLPQWRVLPAWMCWEEAPRLFASPRPPAPVPPVSVDENTAPAAAMPEAVPPPRPAVRPTASKPANPPPRPFRVNARIVLGIWAVGGLLCLLPPGTSLFKLRRISKRVRRLTDGGLLATITAVADDLATIRSALRDNVQSPNGTAQLARSARIEIAGATGTSQLMNRGQRSNNAVFLGYAPASAPQYAIAVIVENGGSGGKISAPLARMILEGPTSDPAQPSRLSPANGHLERIEELR